MARSALDGITKIGSAIRGSAGPVLRQIRKFSAMAAFVKVLPDEIKGMAAPYDIRLARAEGAQGELADLSTMYVYAVSRTVASVIEMSKQKLIKQTNSRLQYALIEDLRTEVASPAKIEKQLNILALEPD